MALEKKVKKNGAREMCDLWGWTAAGATPTS